MAYEKKMSSNNPGLIVILLDQSWSMTDEYVENENKSVFATKAINRVIHEIILANADGNTTKNRCIIAIYGYGGDKEMLLKGSLQDLEEQPIRIENLKKKSPDGAGGIIELDFKLPIWVEAEEDGNGTPMEVAFANAYSTISQWIQKRPETPVPIVINISDGMPNYPNETKKEAEKVLQLECEDGNVLIYNAHIGTKKAGVPDIHLPSDKTELQAITSSGDKSNAEFLFDISSDIPANRIVDAKNAGLTPKEKSKGFVFNASAEVLVGLLNFGSSGARDRMIQ